MQIVLAKDFIMDNSHSFSLSDLPISTGEKLTVIIIQDEKVAAKNAKRKVFAHRIPVDNIELPSRDDLHER